MIVNSKWSNQYSNVVSWSCLFKDAVQSDLRMYTKEPTLYDINSLFMFLQSLSVVAWYFIVL